MKRSGGDRHHEHDYGGCHLLVPVVGDEASGDCIDSTGAWESVAPLLLNLISQTPLCIKMSTMYREEPRRLFGS